MILTNGFFIGDDGRVVMNDNAPVGFWQGIPYTSLDSNAGIQSGTPKFYNNRVSMDASGKLIYLDNADTPYTGKVIYNGGMPFSVDGALLCDSAAAVKTYEGGLPYSVNGFLCIHETTPVIRPTVPTNLKSTALTQADVGTFTFTPSTIADPGKVASYVAKDSLGKSGAITVTGTTTLTFTWQFAKPSQNYTIQVAAVSDKGAQSDWSTPVSVTTYPDCGLISSVTYPSVGAITASWKNNTSNGNAPITAWQFRLDNKAGSNRIWTITPTQTGDTYTASLSGIPNEYCGEGASMWVIAVNATGNGSNNGAPAYPINIPVPVAPGIPVPTWGQPDDTSISVEFVEVSGTKPITYWAEVKANGTTTQMELDVVYASQDVFGKLNGLKPGTPYIVTLYATNSAGTGLKSQSYSFSTTDSMRPVAPVLNNVYPAKTSLVFAFTYPQNLEPEFYTAYASDGTKTTKAEVFDPDQDTLLDGLTEGVEYTCWVTATSAQGLESPKSNEIKMTCKTVIPAPKLNGITGGNGTARLDFTQITPPQPWVVDHYSYVAKNVNKPEDPELEGYILVDGEIALPNDITWSVSICAVCNPGLVPGDFSESMEVTPEEPRAPYRPVITTAYVQPNGQVYIEWAKGVNGSNRNSSALDVKSWQVNVLSADGKGNNMKIDIPDPNTTKLLTEKVTIGWWEIIIYANNDNGRSEGSVPAGVQYNPTKDAPFIGGVPYEDPVYKYIVFNSGATTGYEALRTETGKGVAAEVLLVGAGGGGKGQTLTGGKGGDGGGGQLVITDLPPSPIAGSIFVTVPNGAKGGSGDNPANTKVKEGDFVVEAVAGKTATDKNDAAGYPKTEVPVSWQQLNMFRFLEPGSHFVGGAAQLGEQNYPNATFCGQGGSGTKGTQPGRGGESFVAIRWKK